MKILLTLFFALLYVSCNNEVKNEHSYLECVIYWVSDHQPKTHPWGPNNEPEERRIAIGATIYNHTKNRMFVPVQDFRDSIYCSRIVVKYKGKDITYKSEIRFPSKQRSYNDIHVRGNNYILNPNDSMFLTLGICTPSLSRSQIPLYIDIDSLLGGIVFKYEKCYKDTQKVHMPIGNIIFRDSIIQVYQPEDIYLDLD